MSERPFDSSRWSSFTGYGNIPIRTPQRRHSSPRPINKRDGMILADVAYEHFRPEGSVGECSKDASSEAKDTGRQIRFDSKVEEAKDDDSMSLKRGVADMMDQAGSYVPEASVQAPSASPRSSSSEAVSMLSSDEENDSSGFTSIGRWHCCKCDRGHRLLRYRTGPHLVSILRCACPHKSCEECSVSGQLEVFRPMSDYAPIPFAVDAYKSYKNLHYGVCCRVCGLSWRVQKQDAEQSSRPSKITTSLHVPNPLEKLRTTRSMINLSRPDSGRPAPFLRHVFSRRRQTRGAVVKFSGIQCTCGHVTDSSSLMFKILDAPKAKHADAPMQRNKGKKTVQPPWPRASESLASTLDLDAKGHRSQFVRLKGISHPNPLMSNPPHKSLSSPPSPRSFK